MSYETQLFNTVFGLPPATTSTRPTADEVDRQFMSRFESNKTSIPITLKNGSSAVVDLWNGNARPNENTNVSFLNKDSMSKLPDVQNQLREIDQKLLKLPNLKELIKTHEDFLSNPIKLSGDLYGGEQAFAYSSISNNRKGKNYEEFESLVRQRISLFRTHNSLVSEITRQAMKKASDDKLNVVSIKVNGQEIMKTFLTEGYGIESAYKEPLELRSLRR
jgi:hypothetical protein